MKKFVFVVMGMLGGGGLYACTSQEQFVQRSCNPDGLLLDPVCRVQADAGTDAASDASSDAARVEATCGGRCVPVPSGNNAGLWSEVPISLWVGPAPKPGEAPPACPGDVSSEKFRLFAALDAPPAACDACECEPSEGKCGSGIPEKIEIRAGSCTETNASTLPFNGPPGWDGSCTSEGALPTGALCNGELCAQSVPASPLPGPTTENCAPKSGTPTFAKSTSWQLHAIACMANTDDDLCGEKADKQYCVSEPGPGWLHCVSRAGEHDVCPENYKSSRWVLYEENAVLDDRDCADCECGAPSGSECVATLRLFDDAACTKQFAENLLGSTGDQCTNLFPDGHAIGAKAITDVSYVPGSCSAIGGEPKGQAKPDAKGAVTFCCLPQFYDIE